MHFLETTAKISYYSKYVDLGESNTGTYILFISKQCLLTVVVVYSIQKIDTKIGINTDDEIP